MCRGVDSLRKPGRDREPGLDQVRRDVPRRVDSAPCGAARSDHGDRPRVLGRQLASDKDQRRPVVDGAQVLGVPVVEDGQQPHPAVFPLGDLLFGGLELVRLGVEESGLALFFENLDGASSVLDQLRIHRPRVLAGTEQCDQRGALREGAHRVARA